MSVLSVSFTAVGVGPVLGVKHLDSFTWNVSGTFSANLALERSLDGFITAQTIVAISTTGSGTVYVESPNSSTVQYRWRCVAFASGTAVCVMTDAAMVTQQFVDNAGVTVAQVAEGEFQILGNLDVSGNSALDGLINAGNVINENAGINIASAATLDLDSASGNVSDITGTTTITAITLSNGRTRTVRFAGILTLTHGASLVLPGGVNIITAVGDYARFSGYGAGVVRCTDYTKASGTPLSFARTLQTYIFAAGSAGKVGTTSGWVPMFTDNINLATLPAGSTNSTLVIPIQGLKVGMIITQYFLIGQIESTSGASATLNAQLHKQTAAAADVTDANLGSMTPLTVVVDTLVDVNNANRTIATNGDVTAIDTFYVLVTGTTAVNSDVALQGVGIVVTEPA